MDGTCSPYILLIADEDPDDKLLLMCELNERRSEVDIHFVEDGEELFDYLYQRGSYSNSTEAPQPSLILMDPLLRKLKVNESLTEIRHKFPKIPLLLMLGQPFEEEMMRAKKYPVQGYLQKPFKLEEVIRWVREGDFDFSS